MTSKLPVMSGAHLIRARETFSYLRVRQKGSHVRLRHATDTLRSLLRFRFMMKLRLVPSSGFLVIKNISTEELNSIL